MSDEAKFYKYWINSANVIKVADNKYLKLELEMLPFDGIRTQITSSKRIFASKKSFFKFKNKEKNSVLENNEPLGMCFLAEKQRQQINT